MVWAVMLSALLAFAVPNMAYAEDGGEDSAVAVPVVDFTPSADDASAIDRLRTDLLLSNEVTQRQLSTLIEYESTPDVQKEVDGMQELDYLASIDSKLDALQEVPVEIETQASLGAASTVSFNAYSNVSPTGQFATYAAGMLPRVGYGEHYVYLQDTNSSYVFVWGNLSNGTTISGDDARWVRWYYAGNGYGYLEEYGSGSVTINVNEHVVLSDLGVRPMLEGNEDLTRKEVAFYALVAVVLWSLAGIWGFTVRLRGYVSE